MIQKVQKYTQQWYVKEMRDLSWSTADLEEDMKLQLEVYYSMT